MGRRKGSLGVQPADTYVCSVCKFEAKLLAKTNDHIVKEHIGQALVNQPNRELTDNEQVTGYINYVKKFKVLKCPSCDKAFKSGLGYKYHTDRCGKDPAAFNTECQICSAIVKTASLMSHMQSQHTATKLIKREAQQNENDVPEVDSTTGRKKRQSSQKALTYLKTLATEDSGDEDGEVPVKRKHPDDIEFEFAKVDQLESDSEDDEVEEVDGKSNESEASFSEDSDVVLEIDDKPIEQDNAQLDLVFLEEFDRMSKIITLYDIDEMFTFIKPFIRRIKEESSASGKLIADFNCPKLDSISLEANAESNALMFPCHRKECPEKFVYRVEMENHYRKCLASATKISFYFKCHATEDCEFRANFFNFQLCKHIFQHHLDVLKDNNHPYFDKWFKYFYQSSQFRAKTYSYKSLKGRAGPKSSVPGVYTAKYLQQIVGRYLGQLIATQKAKYFNCLSTVLPTDAQWRHKVFEHCPKEVLAFKSTVSLSNGDNGYKLLDAHQSIKLFDGCYTFNVGNLVTAIGWVPLPLRTRHASFKHALAEELEQPPTQFILLATSSFEEQYSCLKKIQTPNLLQLWDMGQLVVNRSKVAETRGTNNQQPRMAMNIMHDYGVVKAIEWCPQGVTYNDRNLGLVALGSDNGVIRLVAMPQPRLLANAYDPSQVFIMPAPIMLLKHTFAGVITKCNSIAWQPRAPFDCLLAAYNEGYVFAWSLKELVGCEQGDDVTGSKCKHRGEAIMCRRTFEEYKNYAVYGVRWLTEKMFVTVGIHTAKLWHVDYDECFQEVTRMMNFVHLSIHPMWSETALYADLGAYKKSSYIYMSNFYSRESDQVAMATVRNMSITSTSVSPWQYTLAYTTNHGELHITNPLPTPDNLDRRMKHFRLCRIQYGHLCPTTEEVNDADQSTYNTGSQSSNPKKPRKGRPNNISANETLDMEQKYATFLKQYFMIFCDKEEPHAKQVYSSEPLTEHDSYEYHAMSHATWCPNLTAYSWLFSATNSGLCRLNNFMRVPPERLN